MTQIMTSKAVYYIVRALAALAAIPFHEAGHALASWLLGDPTAKNEGRLSLNPLAHFDLLGTLCMIVAGVGWAKPVATDPRRFKSPRLGMALTALAGPLANIIMAYLATVLWKLMYYWSPTNGAAILVTLFLRVLISMNIGLAVFNLIPVPPLDGSRVLFAVLPRSAGEMAAKYEKVMLAVLLAAVWSGVLDTPLYWLDSGVWRLLDAGTGYIDKIAYSAYYASIGTVV